MNISGKTIAGLAAISLAALAGCGGEPTTPKPETTANIQGRALERIKTIEEQLSSGEAKAQDVRTLITSLNYLAARARAEQVGAAAQVAEVESLAAELAQKAEGASRPSPDWTPGKSETGACGIDRDTLKALLPKIRDAVAALK